MADSRLTIPAIVGFAAGLSLVILLSFLFSDASPSRIHFLPSAGNQTFLALIRYSGNLSALSVPNGSCREHTNVVSSMSGIERTDSSTPLDNGTFQSFNRTYQIYLPSTLVYNHILYYIYLNTNDKNIWGADTEASWLNLPENMTERFAPVKIEKGSFANRTLFIRTYSTNGPS